MIADKEQEIASKYIENDSLIIAGAGSGKTTTLLLKIDYLIKQGIKENEILVISFTNETVNNFINKCKYNIDVMTFHKLANKIIKNDKEIVDDEFLKDCIIKYFKNIPTKLKKKLYISFVGVLYTDVKYNKNIEAVTSSSITSYFYSTIKQLIANMIDINKCDITRFKNNEKILLYCTKKIIDYYNEELVENNFIDFDSLIIEATRILNDQKIHHNYKHILVDEYQDISMIRLNFLKSLIKVNNSILTAVGDDFQSIYGFSGSNINLFYNFQKHFKNSKIFYIHTSYRCPRLIVKKAGRFIMKNPCQIKKNIISNSKVRGKIIKIRARSFYAELIKIIRKYRHKNKSILIIGRNNFDINFYINKKNRVENSYIVYNNKTYKNIRYLTVHKSKGLEADITIIINLSNSRLGFPCRDNNTLIPKLIKNEETYLYAEERRLFYVALTRCKLKTYLIINRKAPSEFISEI
ncbi:MAG: UvrD-helicase domain-containing protein [Bacilli bacterium]|nr:UvrD-helicase domain-containing protein [Bacilli bacterium]